MGMEENVRESDQSLEVEKSWNGWGMRGRGF